MVEVELYTIVRFIIPDRVSPWVDQRLVAKQKLRRLSPLMLVVRTHNSRSFFVIALA